MQNCLEKLISETQNKKPREDLLLLQDFENKADYEYKVFIEAMLKMCGCCRDKSIFYNMSISIGNLIPKSNVFQSYLQSIVTNPIVVVSHYEDEPQLHIREKYDSVATFNMADIWIKQYEINEIDENTLFYLFHLHSNQNNIDYQVVIKSKKHT